MNAVKGPSTSVCDKDKKWQNELLMERLKSKSSQHRNFPDMAKAMRMALLEKRYALDHVEKANLQKCLDSMQHCIKVTTRQGLVERLESLTRQLGLKFMEDQSGLFISSDMFYLEIVLNASGVVQDVKVHHEGNVEQQSCKELVQCLTKGDFTDFTQQLEGLASIYQLNAEQKIKSKAFVALQALETDLANIFMFNNVYKDPLVLLLKSAVGILQPRRGGHPMKLTFFVSPYDLLDIENNTLQTLTLEVINNKNIGVSVTINLESSAANKLQIMPILMINKDQQGRSTPVYTLLGPHNSAMLPASFVLRLNKPMPVACNLIQQMIQVTDLSFGEQQSPKPLLNIIAQNESKSDVKITFKGSFVSLPDQNHCYFLSNNSNLNGILLNSIPFTEPNHVPQILNLLRLQAAFNTLISSCIRVKGKQDIENAIMFEVSAISCQLIIISLEHPFEESLATVEINLSDLTNIICKIYTLGKTYDQIALKLSKIVQKCMSIPITMRALVKLWEQEYMKSNLMQQRNLDNGNFNLNLGPNDPGGRNNSNDFNRDIKPNIKTERNSGNSFNGGINNRSMFHQSNSLNVVNPSFSEHMFNSENNSILSQLTSGNSQESMGFNNELSVSSKMNKKRRTNATAEDFYKSPKSNNMDTENSNNSSELLLECSYNSSDSNSLGTSLSNTSEPGVATPVSNMEISDTDHIIDLLPESITALSDGDEEDDDEEPSDTELNEFSKDPLKTSNLSKKSSSTKSGTMSANINTALSGLERRPGIEILPYSTAPTQNLPSSISITPINSSSKSGGDRKSSSSSGSNKERRSSEERRQEKKKKRKRDDSPMGPPDKLPFKPDGSIKSSGSIRSHEGSPSSPNSSMRKHSSSPSGKSSHNSRPSPKSSPIYHGSPKHSGLSPRSSSMSPKHFTSSGSGKPSMSQLKSATNSPSSKSSSEKSSKSSNRDSSGGGGGGSSKERSEKIEKKSSSSSGNSSPKLKQTSVKLNKLDLNALSIDLITTGSTSYSDGASTSPTDPNKISSSSNQVKNRKGSLSAVIDKLKSAQSVTEELSPSQNISSSSTSTKSSSPVTQSNLSSKEKTHSLISNQYVKQDQNKSSSSGSSVKVVNSPTGTGNKSTEYMVKPSSDGIKLTINKTKSKELLGKVGSSGRSSPLSKSQMISKPNSTSNFSSSKKPSTSTSGGSSSSIFKSTTLQKSNSSGNLSAALSLKSSSTKTGLSKTASSGNLSSINLETSSKRDKDKFSKHSSKLPSSSERPSYRDNDVMKLLGFTPTTHTIEGFAKTFDTKKFQIPKLSARTTTTDGNSNNNNNNNNNNIVSNNNNNNNNNNDSFQDDNYKKPNKISRNEGTDLSNQMLADLLSKDIPPKFPFTINKLDSTNTGIGVNSKLSHQSSDGSSLTSKIIDKNLSSSTVSALSRKNVPTSLSNSFNSNLCDSSKLLNNLLTSKDNSKQQSKLIKPRTTNDMMDYPTVNSEEKRHFSSKENVSNLKLTPSSSSSSSSTSSSSSSANVRKPSTQQTKGMFPVPSSSVSVHIVKSPVPSPLMVIPSPHSNSPCITDDELMDEALVGISGK